MTLYEGSTGGGGKVDAAEEIPQHQGMAVFHILSRCAHAQRVRGGVQGRLAWVHHLSKGGEESFQIACGFGNCVYGRLGRRVLLDFSEAS